MPKNPKRVAAGRKSKRKGGSNERILAKLFKEWWGEGEWARTPSSGGWATKETREGFRTCGDIITTAEDFPFCIEAKNQEGWELDHIITAPKSVIWKWWKQTVDETPEDLVPLLVMTRNNRPQLVVVRHILTGMQLGNLKIQHLVLLHSNEGSALIIVKLDDFFRIPSESYRKTEYNASTKTVTGTSVSS